MTDWIEISVLGILQQKQANLVLTQPTMELLIGLDQEFHGDISDDDNLSVLLERLDSEFWPAQNTIITKGNTGPVQWKDVHDDSRSIFIHNALPFHDYSSFRQTADSRHSSRLVSPHDYIRIQRTKAMNTK
jgi:hypothetical protein